jgi:outer membrane protein TolC
VSYLDVVTAQTTVLNNERTAEQIDARRAIASVGLPVSLDGDRQHPVKSSGQ